MLLAPNTSDYDSNDPTNVYLAQLYAAQQQAAASMNAMVSRLGSLTNTDLGSRPKQSQCRDICFSIVKYWFRFKFDNVRKWSSRIKNKSDYQLFGECVCYFVNFKISASQYVTGRSTIAVQ